MNFRVQEGEDGLYDVAVNKDVIILFNPHPSRKGDWSHRFSFKNINIRDDEESIKKWLHSNGFKIIPPFYNI